MMTRSGATWRLVCGRREEQRSFEAWRDSLETVPTIKALRSKAEAIRASEFEKVRLGAPAWSPAWCGCSLHDLGDAA
jgi:hypothetical protein